MKKTKKYSTLQIICMVELIIKANYVNVFLQDLR